MRGQAKNASQQATVNRLLAKGCRDGQCYRGYPGHSSVASRNVSSGYQRSK